jgi:sigma-B regulation protein RsbU (phosphoserine phosphatase)
MAPENLPMTINPEPITIDRLQCMEIWGGNRSIYRTVTTPGLDIAIFSRPFEDATGGGDVHYVSLCGGGKITRLILADISGHGASVNDLAKSLRLLMRKYINRVDQTRLIRSLNREFTQLAKLSRFATAVVATYVTSGDTLTICNAGHPRPLYWRAATASWSVLSHDGPESADLKDLPLGILEETDYSQFELPLGRGDLVLLYTDALTEAEGPYGRLLGESGLLELVRGLDPYAPASFPAALISALRSYTLDRPAGDDLSFLLLHHNAGPARPPGFVETWNVYAKAIGLKSV